MKKNSSEIFNHCYMNTNDHFNLSDSSIVPVAAPEIAALPFSSHDIMATNPGFQISFKYLFNYL